MNMIQSILLQHIHRTFEHERFILLLTVTAISFNELLCLFEEYSAYSAD